MSLYGLPGNWVTLRPESKHTCGWCLDEDTGEYCGKEATHRQQGETDSFGAEYEYYCTEHTEAMKKLDEETVQEEAHCDWCKKLAILRPQRDIDEGDGGPVYEVCSACIQKQNRDAQAELDGYCDDDD